MSDGMIVLGVVKGLAQLDEFIVLNELHELNQLNDYVERNH